ncbi:tigger transposable element-derived protein 6-like [Parasteatoda tepidariorum]|uniref:tigger transposable element-derived protein 6-like n=1 Tax=Parasteatoda tepidariorum TaxID=114398 RepID=UPI00077F84AA|nr:tigger transposable element-derived protein 6-like [Parasteatoda tepidariorum]
MARAQNIPISGLILKEKALQFANELGVSEFSASNGWFEWFKERHGLSFKKMCGEVVDTRPVEEWKNDLLKDVLQRYNPCDVFNLDETGLFFRLVPDKTLTFQSEGC